MAALAGAGIEEDGCASRGTAANVGTAIGAAAVVAAIDGDATRDAMQTNFRRELLARIDAFPGVEAAMITDLPLAGGGYLLDSPNHNP